MNSTVESLKVTLLEVALINSCFRRLHLKRINLMATYTFQMNHGLGTTFEVHFHGTNADRHGSTKDRSFRLHKQIKTPKLISYRKKLERREKKKQLTELAANLQLCYTSDRTSRTIHSGLKICDFFFIQSL